MEVGAISRTVTRSNLKDPLSNPSILMTALEALLDLSRYGYMRRLWSSSFKVPSSAYTKVAYRRRRRKLFQSWKVGELIEVIEIVVVQNLYNF